MIKILLGGSPCTKWSVAQSNNRETQPKGVGWELFKNYVIAKERFNPDYFLYENNMSADDKIKKRIEKELHQKMQPINYQHKTDIDFMFIIFQMYNYQVIKELYLLIFLKEMKQI